MAEKYELAEQDYKAGMKYKDIAEKYGVSLNTVKSWKTRKWGKDDDEKSVHTKSESVHTKEIVETTLDAPVSEAESAALDEYGLTWKQRHFVEEYLKTHNATSAYKKAHKCTMQVAMTNGSRMLRNAKVSEAIATIKKERLAAIDIQQIDVLEMYKRIAFADITDVIDFSQVEGTMTRKETRYEDDKEVVVEEVLPYTYTKFVMHHSDEIDGTVITGLERGQDGVFKVKMADKMAALAVLAKYTELLDDKELKELRKEQIRVNTAKARADMNKEVLAPLEITIKGVGEDDN